MRNSILCFALLAAFATPVASHATTFNFNAVGSAVGYSGTGTLTGTSNGDGSFTITGITGPGTNGIIPVNGYSGNDNLLFPNATSLVDGHGLGFYDTMGNTGFDLLIYSYAPEPDALYLNDTDGFSETTGVTFSVAATPEP